MAEAVFNGPVIGPQAHNIVLRDALFHVPTTRTSDTTDYIKVEVGISQGEFLEIIGTWDQRTQRINVGEPLSILDAGRPNMRIKAGQIIVVRLTDGGTPATVQGSRVTFQMARVGGRYGEIRPLVAGPQIGDPALRDVISALQRQINTGGLAEWDESIALEDLS